MLQWLAAEPPEKYQYPLIISFVISLFGVFMYNKARAVEFAKKAPWWKFAWVLIMIGAFVYGVQLCLNLRDPIYNGLIDSRKMRIAHYLAPAIPILVAGAILLVDRTIRKSRSERDDY